MRVWMIALLVAANAACGNASEPSPVPVGEAFELAVDETQQVGDALRVTLDAVVDDSRCPTDVTCVWAGDATLKITAQAGGRSTSGDLHVSRAGDMLSIHGFEIRVRELRPAPLSTRPIAAKDYIALLVVSAAR